MWGAYSHYTVSSVPHPSDECPKHWGFFIRLLLPSSHSLQPSTQTSNLNFLYGTLRFWSASKGRHFAIEHRILWADQVIILLFLPKELREICEFQVSNLTSNWNLLESSRGMELCSIRKLTVCLRLLLWFALWRKKSFSFTVPACSIWRWKECNIHTNNWDILLEVVLQSNTVNKIP